MSELFVEIRCEELPPSMIGPALEGLEKGLLKLLEGTSIGDVRTFATPRRIAVAIGSVPAERPTVERVITGPPADRAFANGQPTQIAIGFARGKGVEVSALQIVETPKGKVVAVSVKEGGERTVELVSAGLGGVIAGIPFAKSMEWGTGGVRFGRPIQGISALFGGAIIPGKLGQYDFGATTIGHRFAPNACFEFNGSEAWIRGLHERWVEPNANERRTRIRALLDEAARELGADPIDEPALLEQVTHLVEWPTKVIGTFEPDLLELPPRLLVESMKVHQRYFPVHRAKKLTNHFVAISNNPVADTVLVASGFARVLRARFHDAKFFFAEDKKRRLEDFGEGLSRMRWIKGLGTMAQKQLRVAVIGGQFAEAFAANRTAVERAGALCKADLLTQMVGEFPELQGHMGRLYAEAQGEAAAAALAIEEHYLPRFADDAVASTPEGLALALADRLDTLVGCFGIGMVPKGGGDPQGLRRAASGLVKTLIAKGSWQDVRDLFRQALSAFHASVLAAPDGFPAWSKERGTVALPRNGDALVEELVEFTLARLKAQVVADGASADLVDAVLIGGEARPLVLHRKVLALRELAETPQWVPILQTLKRVLNISRDAVEGPEAPSAEPAEKALAAALEQSDGKVGAAVKRGDFVEALHEMLALRDPVARFFDEVLVDAPDPAVRAARMGLLKRVSRVFLQVADFTRISTR